MPIYPAPQFSREDIIPESTAGGVADILGGLGQGLQGVGAGIKEYKTAKNEAASRALNIAILAKILKKKKPTTETTQPNAASILSGEQPTALGTSPLYQSQNTETDEIIDPDMLNMAYASSYLDPNSKTLENFTHLLNAQHTMRKMGQEKDIPTLNKLRIKNYESIINQREGKIDRISNSELVSFRKSIVDQLSALPPGGEKTEKLNSTLSKIDSILFKKVFPGQKETEDVQADDSAKSTTAGVPAGRERMIHPDGSLVDVIKEDVKDALLQGFKRYKNP